MTTLKEEMMMEEAIASATLAGATTPQTVLESTREEIKQRIKDSIADYINPYPRSCYYELNLDKLCEYLASLEKSITLQSFIGAERARWKDIFDNPPERNKEYPCDNCTRNIARIEIEHFEELLATLTKHPL